MVQKTGPLTQNAKSGQKVPMIGILPVGIFCLLRQWCDFEKHPKNINVCGTYAQKAQNALIDKIS